MLARATAQIVHRRARDAGAALAKRTLGKEISATRRSDRTTTTTRAMSRFGDVPEAPKDPTLGISEMFNADAHAEKMNLGVVRAATRRGTRGTARGPSTREGAIRARGKVLD